MGAIVLFMYSNYLFRFKIFFLITRFVPSLVHNSVQFMVCVRRVIYFLKCSATSGIKIKTKNIRTMLPIACFSHTWSKSKQAQRVSSMPALEHTLLSLSSCLDLSQLCVVLNPSLCSHICATGS